MDSVSGEMDEKGDVVVREIVVEVEEEPVEEVLEERPDDASGSPAYRGDRESLRGGEREGGDLAGTNERKECASVHVPSLRRELKGGGEEDEGGDGEPDQRHDVPRRDGENLMAGRKRGGRGMVSFGDRTRRERRDE